jgi:hypothetical protein
MYDLLSASLQYFCPLVMLYQIFIYSPSIQGTGLSSPMGTINYEEMHSGASPAFSLVLRLLCNIELITPISGQRNDY